ncbi:MAG: hypothetical protein DHS20C21_18500 [Gemmatimonadota bacterium]|nr:MAG: hypothetical protein DHS20C21_18500 [Gemmatimonadota bacterium]
MKPRVGVVQFTAVCAEGNEHPLACGATYELARRLTSIGGLEANAILLGKAERATTALRDKNPDVPAFAEGAMDFSLPGFGAQFESDYILLGRLQVADGLLFFYRVYEVETGRLIRDGCVNGLRSSVFRLLDDLAKVVRECIGQYGDEEEEPDYNPVFDDVDFDAFLEYCLAREEDRPGNALDHLERALVIEPRFRMALIEYLAGCYEIDDMSKSLVLVEDYLAEEAGDHEVLIAAANLCLAFHRMDDGIAYARRCLQSRPTDTEPHVIMARFLFAREQVSEAGVHLEAALKSQDESPEGRYALGRYFLDLGDFYRARDHFEECLGVDPGYIVALRDLQCCYYELGDFPEAIQACESLLEADPSDAGSHYNLGLVYQRLGRTHLATKFFEESVRQDPLFFKSIFMLGEYHFTNGRIREALARYEDAHRVEPASIEVLSRLGDCHVELGAAAEAYRYYVWARREDPTFENARCEVIEGVALAEDGNLEEARRRLEKAVSLNDTLANAWNELAWVLLRQGRSELALERIRRAAELDADHPSILANLQTVISSLPVGVRYTAWVRRLARETRDRNRYLRSVGRLPAEEGKRRVRRFPRLLTWYALRG